MIPIFRYASDLCPSCGSMLKVRKTWKREVKSTSGAFEVIHKVMYCQNDGREFRSEKLDRIVPLNCVYANDVTVKASMERFINGLSCDEIHSFTGMSESHANRVTNQALTIFHEIHEESIPKLRKNMSGYILQIDGTVDSEFSMIIAVRDWLSGFVLHAEKRDSESEEHRQYTGRNKEEIWIAFRHQTLGMIVSDASTEGFDTGIKNTYEYFKEQGTQFVKLNRIVDTIFFTPFETAIGIQIADFTSYALKRHYENSDSTVFSKIVKKFDHNNGKTHGLKVIE